MFLIEPSIYWEMSSTHLILEKLMMPAQLPRLSRSRLLTLLEKSLASCTSTIISARAGAGKTALAVDFARSCGRRVAWYKVDAPDGELPAFLEYLSAAIREQRPGFRGPREAELPMDAVADHAVSIAERFVYELAESGNEPLLIVIEDLHLVCDSTWLIPFVTRLLPLLPSHVHVLITSRTMPPAPLWRMRSKQTLAVIDEETLKFNRSEAVALFQGYGLSQEQACIALDHTHGRAAALSSFAMTLQLAERKGSERTKAYAQASATVPAEGTTAFGVANNE